MSLKRHNIVDLPDPIDTLRAEISALDSRLLELMAARRKLAASLGQSKARLGLAVRDEPREREILAARMREGEDRGLDSSTIDRVFREIISDSIRLQEALRDESDHDRGKSFVTLVAGLSEVEGRTAAERLEARRGGHFVLRHLLPGEPLGGLLSQSDVDFLLMPFESVATGISGEALGAIAEHNLSIVDEVHLEDTGVRVLLLKSRAPVQRECSRVDLGGHHPLASRRTRPLDTVITVGSVTVGGGGFTVIAGPCSVESYDQVLSCAREVKTGGGHLLRGGCFKSRTSPYSFQGLGFEGLDLLRDAGRLFGLPIITEVLAPEDVAAIAERADVLQIGARNMQNYALLRAVGGVRKPVVLKRGMSASIDEVLLAVEYILSHGNPDVIICERGIRTFETRTRNTLDLSAIPLLKRETHLPVIVDPSHAAGDRDLVPALARAARAVGADGIMVEIHPEPERALSDGPQSLRFSQFQDLMRSLRLAER